VRLYIIMINTNIYFCFMKRLSRLHVSTSRWSPTSHWSKQK